MVYNLRSIGMSLMQNSGQNGCLVKPAEEEHNNSAGSSNTASASSLNNPAGNQLSSPANQNAYLGTYSQQNINQNHGGDTYVSLMSSFEDSRIQSKRKRRKQAKHLGTMEVQNTSFIDLSSDEDYSLDLNTPLHDTSDEEIFNTSNNSAPNESASSADSGSSTTEQKFICSVLNCETRFSSEIRLQNHMELFRHSPCNPCLLARNCKLSNIPICYTCPDCDREFSTSDDCRQHMNRSNHLTFFPPLAIKAYMCSQCLYLFESLDSCWTHMENASHHGMSYPFANDYTTVEKHNGPVAVAGELIQDLLSKCSKVVYTVQCLECGMQIGTPAILKHHMRETRDQHIVAALTETSLVEVFASYLASYSCNICHRLFTGELKELAKHQCAKRIVGTVTENDTQSFAEFIKRCALTVIKSLESENMPGPSRPVRLSPAREKKTKRLEVSCDAAADISGKYMGRKKVPSEESNPSSRRNGIGSSNGLSSVCQSKLETSQKERKSSLESKSDVSVGNDRIENFGAALQPSSTFDNNSVKFLRKSEMGEKNTKNKADFITITDTDECSDEIDSDFPPASGAKRKRKKKAANKSKKGSSDDTLLEPITISASPEASKQNSDNVQESPFFVMNYKPRTSNLNADVLTQGNVVQPSENLTPTILRGRNNQVQPRQMLASPVRYKLRNRNIAETVTTAEDQDIHSVNPVGNLDDSYRNIAQTFLQGASSTADNAAMPRYELLTGDLQLCRRDRSRSPLQNLNTHTSSDEPYYTSLGTVNFPAHHPSHQSNVLSQGHIGQPYHNPFMAVQDATGRLRPAVLPQMAGPLRFQSGNQCNTVIARPLVPVQIVPATIGSQLSTMPAQGHTRSQTLKQNTDSSNLTQAVNPSKTYSNETILPSFETASISGRTTPESNNPSKPLNENMVSTAYLQSMKNIVFLDLDNWPSFFHKLPCCLPDLTFVWGFFGGKNPWYEPNKVAVFRQMKQKGLFYLNERCGTTKDAADFAIVLTVGKMDEKLPTDIAFTIMSGDKGFCEVERQMSNSERKVMVVNPHTAAQFSNDMIYALVTSVTDT